MCHLCETEDDILFDRCVCIICGNEVCYEDTEDPTIRKPGDHWDTDSYCASCEALTEHIPVGEQIPDAVIRQCRGA